MKSDAWKQEDNYVDLCFKRVRVNSFCDQTHLMNGFVAYDECFIGAHLDYRDIYTNSYYSGEKESEK